MGSAHFQYVHGCRRAGLCGIWYLERVAAKLQKLTGIGNEKYGTTPPSPYHSFNKFCGFIPATIGMDIYVILYSTNQGKYNDIR